MPIIKVPTVKSDYKKLAEEVADKWQALQGILGRELLESLQEQRFWNLD
jgi:hypothetical protein